MNKLQLVETVAKKLSVSKASAERTLDCVLEVVKDQVSKGQYVKLVGFGSFEKRKRKARRGYNPQTLEEMRLPAKPYVRFKAGREFKKQIGSKVRES